MSRQDMPRFPMEAPVRRQAYRVFQGKDAQQFYYGGAPLQKDKWFYEPEDWDSDIVWGYPYDTKDEAIRAAEADPELEDNEP